MSKYCKRKCYDIAVIMILKSPQKHVIASEVPGKRVGSGAVCHQLWCNTTRYSFHMHCQQPCRTPVDAASPLFVLWDLRDEVATPDAVSGKSSLAAGGARKHW